MFVEPTDDAAAVITVGAVVGVDTTGTDADTVRLLLPPLTERAFGLLLGLVVNTSINTALLSKRYRATEKGCVDERTLFPGTF